MEYFEETKTKYLSQSELKSILQDINDSNSKESMNNNILNDQLFDNYNNNQINTNINFNEYNFNGTTTTNNIDFDFNLNNINNNNSNNNDFDFNLNNINNNNSNNNHFDFNLNNTNNINTNNNDFDFNLNNTNDNYSNNKSVYFSDPVNLNSFLINNNNKNYLNSNNANKGFYNLIFTNWDKNDQDLQGYVDNYICKGKTEYYKYNSKNDSSNKNILMNQNKKPIATKINQNISSPKNNKKNNFYNTSNQFQPIDDNVASILEKIDNNIVKSNPEQITEETPSKDTNQEQNIPPIPEQTIPPIPEQPNPPIPEQPNPPIPEQPKPPIPEQPKPPEPLKFYFHLKGLYNIGSTCYMNSTLQCLLHSSDLISYFLNEYPKDFTLLQEKNKNSSTHGNISKVFYDLIKEIYPQKNKEKKNDNKTINNNELIQFYSANNISDYDDNNNISNYSNSISPYKIQTTIGNYNPQFKNLEANDSKDLILYLLQSMHSELNYLSNNIINIAPPNQYDRANTYNYFINAYDKQNFSIISKIFYGTYENTTKCKNCSQILYNFQKFEFISFGMYNYDGKDFNIYNGFENNQKVQLLTGDNKFYCNNCKNLYDAEICSKIILPPNNLLINIDYGKNKRYMPKTIIFDEEIDITKYVNFNFGINIKYQLISVCTHYGDSGSYGHYVAFCKNKNNNKWYVFNDSYCTECNKNDIHNGTPYLLLYERIF